MPLSKRLVLAHQPVIIVMIIILYHRNYLLTPPYITHDVDDGPALLMDFLACRNGLVYNIELRANARVSERIQSSVDYIYSDDEAVTLKAWL